MADSTLVRITQALADRYEVLREIGAGGMATVFLAHDLKHDRDVAIKVLHPDLGAALGGERFLSEIKTTAKLQHPHILPLLDSGNADGLLYYVMPYVTGETLRARLERETQLPVADALRIASEVGDALAEAHSKGVIHRDIKPENILLQGTHALVADFGIALAVQQAGGARMTQTGLSLGTPQYMSPEQAMGERTVDHRADIYALAAVTYEMLTGEPPHTGASTQAIVARLLTEPVRPASSVRAAVPAHVDAALDMALQKLPADRFNQVSEFVSALRGGTGAIRSASRAATTKQSAAASSRGRIVAAITLVALSLGAGWMLGRKGTSVNGSAADEVATRFTMELPTGQVIVNDVSSAFALARDGSALVYAASDRGGRSQLFLRHFNETTIAPISGTTGGTNPVFSPDGRWIAFSVGSQIAKVPVEGGQPAKLASVTSSIRGLTWLENGRLLVTVGAGKGYVIPETGGNPEPFLDPPPGAALRWPVVIPGTGRILVSAYHVQSDTTEVLLADIATRTTQVLRGAYCALGVLDGLLVYLTRSGEVMVAPIDLKAGKILGEGVRIATGVAINVGSGLGYAALSPHGDLVFRDREEASQLVYLTPDGRERAVLPDTAAFSYPRFSPDGRLIAVARERESGQAIAVVDRASGILSKITAEEIGITRDRPEWTPKGDRVYYRARNPSMAGFAITTRDGAMREETLPRPMLGQVNEMTLDPSGTHYVARYGVTTYGNQILGSFTTTDTTFHPLVVGPDYNSGARFSPDGKWIAWTAQAGGKNDVFVIPFPGPGERVQISADGGGAPVWSHDGRTLYYLQADRLLASSLAFEGRPRVVSTRVVATGSWSADALHAPFDVDASGTFVLVHPVRAAHTVVIRNFRAEVERRLRERGKN